MTYFRLKPVVKFSINEGNFPTLFYRWPFDYYMALKALGKEIRFTNLYRWWAD